jgi:FlhB-like protein
MTDKRKTARQKAVALHYEAGEDRAPRVTAKGQGLIAQRIIEIAKEHGVRIREDPDLVTMLSKLDVEKEIPEDLYRAVAEVLAFVYRLNQRMTPKHPTTPPKK